MKIAKEEIVPNNRAIWQSDSAKTYRCPTCMRPVFSQYEGDDSPTIRCESDHHVLVWEVASDYTAEDVAELKAKWQS